MSLCDVERCLSYDWRSCVRRDYWEVLKVLLQSNENFRINDGQMTIQVTEVRLPVGSGRKPLHAGLYF